MTGLVYCWLTGGVRIVTGDAIRRILNAGSRAFNLPSPIFPSYQTQASSPELFHSHDMQVRPSPAVR
jgi:hypothetical protein